jgi:hypothetical protein
MPPTSIKNMPPFITSEIFTLSLISNTLRPFMAWGDYHNWYLDFWALFAFGEADFNKITGRETLSRSHKDLNTTEDNRGLTKISFLSTELCKAHKNLKVLFLEFLLIFKIYYYF